ncbi:MAG: HNH endonuclease signature motif containing protein [Candidatus Faecousia sp.]|nr:HNH endonuclease signature motif containing protein [Candidatus Faecousia sp.]
MNWEPGAEQTAQIEQITEEYIQSVVSGSGGRRSVTSSIFVRSAEVVKETRKRANGVCQYCNQPAPFRDKMGNPYLEVHHVIWLSRGGEDSTANTVALCPNCHTRIHVSDEREDIEKLQGVIKANKH